MTWPDKPIDHEQMRPLLFQCSCLLLQLFAAGCADPAGSGKPDAKTADSGDTSQGQPQNQDSGDAAPDTAGPDTAEPGPISAAPVRSTAAYWVQTTGKVVYGQGLSHSEWGSEDAEPMDLIVDVYEPIGAPPTDKPALIIVHGGGFKIGSPTERPLQTWAHFFAARGFVCFSIDYRVAKFYGSIPGDWPTDPASVHPSMDIDQINALYTAGRDLKAAVRWVRANATEYGIHPEAIAAMGGSAGASMVVMLAVSDEDDYARELTEAEDPTLATVHLDQPSHVGAAIDLWGDTSLLDALFVVDGIDRFDATDTPLAIIHGVDDETIPYSEAEELRAKYEATGVPYSFHALASTHSAWHETIEDESLPQFGFGFVVEHLSLTVEP